MPQRISELEDQVAMLQASGVGAKTYIWGARAKIGGAAGTGPLDDIADASITDEDAAVLIEHLEKRAWFYTFLDGSTSAEHWPDVVQPDDAGGNGDWHLANVIVAMDATATLAGPPLTCPKRLRANLMKKSPAPVANMKRLNIIKAIMMVAATPRAMP